MQKSLHSKDYERLRQWLREQRLRQGLTMRGLAEKLAVPHSFIGKVEQGERRLDVIEYLQYCNALDVPPLAGLKKIDPTL